MRCRRSFSPALATVVLLPLILSAHAQVLIDTTAIPACAASCTPFIQAGSSCLPPLAPVSNQATYDSCFCQSAILAPLYSSPNGLCDSFCPSAADRTALQTWYKGKCQPVLKSLFGTAAAATPAATPVPPGTDNAAATTAGADVASTATATTSSATPSKTGGSASKPYVSPMPKSWISTNWKYVVMIIVIFAGLGALAGVAVWLRRRHERRHAIYRQSAEPGDFAAVEAGHAGGMAEPKESPSSANPSPTSATFSSFFFPARSGRVSKGSTVSRSTTATPHRLSVRSWSGRPREPAAAAVDPAMNTNDQPVAAPPVPMPPPLTRRTAVPARARTVSASAAEIAAGRSPSSGDVRSHGDTGRTSRPGTAQSRPGT